MDRLKKINNPIKKKYQEGVSRFRAKKHGGAFRGTPAPPGEDLRGSSRQAGNRRVKKVSTKTPGGSTQKVRDLSGVSGKRQKLLAAVKSARGNPALQQKLIDKYK